MQHPVGIGILATASLIMANTSMDLGMLEEIVKTGGTVGILLVLLLIIRWLVRDRERILGSLDRAQDDYVSALKRQDEKHTANMDKLIERIGMLPCAGDPNRTPFPYDPPTGGRLHNQTPFPKE